MANNNTDICARFSQVPWHDSELIDVHLLRIPEKLQYDLRLDLNLITGYTKAGPEMTRCSVLFVGCRIIKLNFDLLGILICSGAIASGVCYPDPTELERRKGLNTQEFGFPQDHNPVEKCTGFFIEMINPGGEILIVAQDFQLHNANELST